MMRVSVRMVLVVVILFWLYFSCCCRPDNLSISPPALPSRLVNKHIIFISAGIIHEKFQNIQLHYSTLVGTIYNIL